MARQVAWNRIILEEFIRLGCLSAEEEEILRTHVAGWSRQRQSMELNLSLSSIDRRLRKLKSIYDNVQPHSDILPPRRFSVGETYGFSQNE